MVETLKKPLAYASKTTEMWGMRLMMLGGLGMAFGAAWGAGLLVNSGVAYGFDKLGDKVLKTDKASEEMFGRKPTIGDDIRGAARFWQLLPQKR